MMPTTGPAMETKGKKISRTMPIPLNRLKTIDEWLWDHAFSIMLPRAHNMPVQANPPTETRMEADLFCARAEYLLIGSALLRDFPLAYQRSQRIAPVD